MNSPRFIAELKLTETTGPVKARADVRIELPGGSLELFGFSVIQKDGEPPWVGFPQKQGKIPGKYFPVVTAEGEVRKEIIEVILETYETSAHI